MKKDLHKGLVLGTGGIGLLVLASVKLFKILTE